VDGAPRVRRGESSRKSLDRRGPRDFQWLVPWRRYRVLAAEDDPQLREVLRDALELDGFDACCVADGVAAREHLASSGPYDVLLLDDRMPRLSGREFLRELRAAGTELPVVLLSGECELNEQEWATLRPSAMLRKPTAMSAIARALRAAIERTLTV